MSSSRQHAELIDIDGGDRSEETPALPFSAELIGVSGTGELLVRSANGRQVTCECLQQVFSPGLQPGDRLLVQPLAAPGVPVVLGRIGPYQTSPELVSIEASQTLRLRCGAASVDLRADGKVMIRGDDVLVRAKGTKRIRAGTVSIN